MSLAQSLNLIIQGWEMTRERIENRFHFVALPCFCFVLYVTFSCFASCFQSSPPSSPNLIVKPRKKPSHEKILVPMQAIHERLSQEIDDSVHEPEKNNNVHEAIEVGVPAEELDNIVNNLEENYYEEEMKNQLDIFSKSSPEIHIERAVSVPNPQTEKEERISKALSEGAISKNMKKKVASKTVSDPSQRNSLHAEVDSSAKNRPRSSSDPDADVSNLQHVEQNPEQNTRHKHRRLSLTSLTFKKNKNKNKHKEKHPSDSSDGPDQSGKSDDESKPHSHYPHGHNGHSDDHSDSDVDERPPPKSFLRRMSVKMKHIMLGNEKEERKFKVDIIDLTNDQGKFSSERVSVDELQNAILPGMSALRLLSTHSLKYSAILTMFLFLSCLAG